MFQVTQDVKNKYSEENKKQQEASMHKTIEGNDYIFTHETNQRFLTGNAKAKLGDQVMTVKHVWGQAFLDQYKGYFSENLYHSENALDYEKVAQNTELTKDRINQIRDFSAENTGRSDKRRKHHVKKTNYYAKEMLEKRQEFLTTSNDLIQMRGQYEFGKKEGSFNEKDYAKLCAKKLKMELGLIEDNYKLEMHALKIEGNKDADEGKKLDAMKKVCLAKKINCLKNMKEEAKKHPQYISEKDLDKQIQTLEKEFFQLNDNEQLTDEEKLQRQKNLSSSESKIRKRLTVLEKKQQLEDGKKYFLANYQNELIATKNVLLTDCPPEEVEWRKEIVNEHWIAESLAQVADNVTFMKQTPEAVKDLPFYFKAACLRRLFFAKTELSFVDDKKLREVGVADGGIDRTVKSQLKPVRRMKNGAFVSDQDQLNEEWNQKWINSFYDNDMVTRKECIKENNESLKNTKISGDTISSPEELFKNFDEVLRLQRIVLCQSNMASREEFTAESKIQNNAQIYKELCEEQYHIKKIEGCDYDETDAKRDEITIISDKFEELTSFNFFDGRLMSRPMGQEFRDYLKGKINDYYSAGNQA